MIRGKLFYNYFLMHLSWRTRTGRLGFVDMSPRLLKILRYALFALGLSTAVSAIINIVAAFRLLEPSDEQVLGLGRNQIIAGFAVELTIGLALIVLGFFCRRKPPGGKSPGELKE